MSQTIAWSILFSVLSFSTSNSFANEPVISQIPQFGHVYVVVEENHSYSSVIGSSEMPYLNGLANKYGLATNFYANSHPSIGNYFMITSGVVFTTNDGYSKTVAIDNIARQLIAGGKTWKAYNEGLPSVGFTGQHSGAYARKHNPLSFFSDVVDDQNQKDNLVPMDQWAKDIANNTLPNYSFIVPNLDDDAHDGTLGAADQWLQTNIEPLILSAAFQNDGLLIITFDESGIFDGAHGGGHIPVVVISSKVKPGVKSNTFYQLENILKTSCDALGVAACPGAAATAGAMADFF